MLIYQRYASMANSGRPVGDDFSFLSLEDGRGFLLPLNSGRSAQAALTLYHAQTVKARLLKKLLAYGFRLGIAQAFLPKVTFTASQSTVSEGDPLLFDYLREILENRTLTFAVSLGTPGPQRKPVIVALAPDGTPTAFMKVGWSGLTRRLVEAERHALEFLATQPFRWGCLPRVLHYRTWRDCRLLIIEPIAVTATPRVLQFTGLHLGFLLELAHVRILKLPWEKSFFMRRLLTRLQRIQADIPLYQRRILNKAVESIRLGLKDCSLPWVWRMGDFAPWNIGVDPVRKKIHVIDFEYAEADSLPGWDIFHFLRVPLSAGAEHMPFLQQHMTTLAPYFSSLQIDRDQIGVLYLAYLLDLYVQWKHLCGHTDEVPWATLWFREQTSLIASAMLQLETRTTYTTHDTAACDVVGPYWPDCLTKDDTLLQRNGIS